MLIEMMEMNGIQVVSGNTDGIVCMFPKEKEETYNKLCTEWENKVGNHDMGKLEYTDFKSLYQEGVNSYIGIKIDGSVKKKGRFVTEFELNKNKSSRVIQLACEQYFLNGTDPVKFITSHKNIFDFCIAKKAVGKMYYEEILNEKDIKRHKKLIRYYISENGNVFKKRGSNYKDGEVDSYCEAPHKDFFWLGEPKMTYFNQAFISADYKIDYKFYVINALERIDKIEKTKKAKTYAESFKPTTQGSLF